MNQFRTQNYGTIYSRQEGDNDARYILVRRQYTIIQEVQEVHHPDTDDTEQCIIKQYKWRPSLRYLRDKAFSNEKEEEECKICKITVPKYSQLRHVTTNKHTKQKPYECIWVNQWNQFCGKRFKDSRAAIWHAKQHLGSPRGTETRCPDCGQMLARKWNAQHHKETAVCKQRQQQQRERRNRNNR